MGEIVYYNFKYVIIIKEWIKKFLWIFREELLRNYIGVGKLFIYEIFFINIKGK